ncbi:MAG: CHAD domain-containing protein [Gammaproteobacteria bacterium]|nr:CHAD domain-containing protein [Gammaproteobacteria bacterium]
MKTTENLPHSWILEDDAQLRDLLAALGKKFAVSETGQLTQRVTYLDTFDWRIWRKGDVLEYREFGRQKKLLWRSIDHAAMHVEIPLDECPVFINEIPDWLQPKKLLKYTRPRALVEQALSRMQSHSYDMRDKDEKVVCRMAVVKENIRLNNNRTGEALPVRLQMESIRGYEKDFARIIKVINKTGLQVYGKDPLTRLLNLDERRPCDYSNRLRLQLRPDQRTDEAARQIMLQLIQMMEVNEHGIRDDLDTEFLSDYRLAIQRAHSLLKQLKQVIPEDTRTRFDHDLVWINDETRRLFELNSWLLGFNDFRELLDKNMRPHLDELLDWLRSQRQTAQQDVIKLFENKTYRQFMKRWRIYLECEVPEHSVLKHAEKPVLKIAGRQIWKTYQKLAGYRAVNEQELLQHDLPGMDEVCTTLNDLLALSRALYTDAKVARLSASMQALHAALDNCVERQIQVRSLRQFIKGMKAKGLQHKKFGQALEQLLERIQEKESACLKELQSSYTAIVQDDMHDTYQQLFKNS